MKVLPIVIWQMDNFDKCYLENCHLTDCHLAIAILRNDFLTIVAWQNVFEQIGIW
jgi:hypothetical protein